QAGLERRRADEELIRVEAAPGRGFDGDEPELSRRQGAGLVQQGAAHRCEAFEHRRGADHDPSAGGGGHAHQTAMGVAMPSAHGHATTSTADGTRTPGAAPSPRPPATPPATPTTM